MQRPPGEAAARVCGGEIYQATGFGAQDDGFQSFRCCALQKALSPLNRASSRGT